MFKFCANLGFMMKDQPLVERIAGAARAGMHGVEFPFFNDLDLEAVAKAARDNNIAIAQINSPSDGTGNVMSGLLIAPEEQEKTYQDSIALAVRAAGMFNCDRVHVISGFPKEGESAETLEARVVRRLQYAADALAEQGIYALLEPINRFDLPGYYLNDLNQALRIIQKVGRKNVHLQYDIYHAQRICGDLVRFLRDNFALIGHIQVADNPERHQPGTGEINYPFIFGELRRLGYEGWIGLEYIPDPDFAGSLGWIKDMGLDK